MAELNLKVICRHLIESIVVLLMFLSPFVRSRRTTRNGVSVDVKFTPGKKIHVVERDVSLSINCSATITNVTEHNGSHSNQFHRLKIVWLDDVMNEVEIPKTSNKSKVAVWVSFDATHDFEYSWKRYACVLEHRKSSWQVVDYTQVVFAAPPNKTTGIRTFINENTLFVFAYTESNPVVRRALRTRFTLRAKGQYPCKSDRNWLKTSGCSVENECFEANTVTCVLHGIQCTIYDVTLAVENRFGEVSSNFTTRETNISRSSVIIQNAFHSTNQILTQLHHDLPRATLGFQYKLKYKQRGFQVQRTSQKNAIAIHSLEPNQCYDVSVSMTSRKYAQIGVHFNWSPWQRMCTTPEVIVSAVEDFRCIENSVNSWRRPAVAKLTWKIPVLERRFGGVKEYMLQINFDLRGKIDNINQSFSAVDSNGVALVQHNEFYFVPNVTFVLVACNSMGCSNNHSVCHLVFFEESASLSPIWNVICFLIPAITFGSLLFSACLSYYRKKALDQSSEGANSDHNSNSMSRNEERRCSSKRCTKVIEANSKDKNKYVDM